MSIEHLEGWKVFYSTKAAILAKLSQENSSDYQEQYQKQAGKSTSRAAT